MSQKTQAELLTAFADNTSGNITPSNLRDFTVSVLNYLDGLSGNIACNGNDITGAGTISATSITSGGYNVATLDVDGNITGKIVVYNDTSTNLNSIVLERGQLGYATDNFTLAVGDGTNTFPNLSTNFNSDRITATGFAKSVPPFYLNALASLASYSQVFYVATTGSNMTGDGSTGNPWADPAFALQQLFLTNPNGNFFISCAAGTYNLATAVTQNLDLTNGGTAINVWLIGSGSGTTTITTNYNGIMVDIPAQSYIGQLTLINTYPGVIFGIAGFPYSTVIDRVVATGTNAFYLSFSTVYVDFYNCTLNNSGSMRLAIDGTGGVNFYSCIINTTASSTGSVTGIFSTSNLNASSFIGCQINTTNTHATTGGAIGFLESVVKNTTTFVNCAFTTIAAGTKIDIAGSNYGFNNTGSGAGGSLILAGGTVITQPVTDNLFAALYSTDIVSNTLSSSSITTDGIFNQNGNAFLGFTYAADITIGYDPQNYGSLFPYGLILNAAGGAESFISLNNFNPISAGYTVFLQLDGGNFNMLNGSGTGCQALGSIMWLDGAIINMGDGAGGSVNPGATLNMDGGTVAFGNNPGGTPTNQVTPVGWVQVTVGGTTSYLPYYQ